MDGHAGWSARERNPGQPALLAHHSRWSPEPSSIRTRLRTRAGAAGHRAAGDSGPAAGRGPDAVRRPARGGPAGADRMAGAARYRGGGSGRAARAGYADGPHPRRGRRQSRFLRRTGRGGLRPGPAMVGDRSGRHAEPHPPDPSDPPGQLARGRIQHGLAGSADRGIPGPPAGAGGARPAGADRTGPPESGHGLWSAGRAGGRPDRGRPADAPERAGGRGRTGQWRHADQPVRRQT